MTRSKIIYTLSAICVLINLGLFLFAYLVGISQLQILSLFNVACFLVYFAIVENINV